MKKELKREDIQFNETFEDFRDFCEVYLKTVPKDSKSRREYDSYDKQLLKMAHLMNEYYLCIDRREMVNKYLQNAREQGMEVKVVSDEEFEQMIAEMQSKTSTKH